MMGSIVPRIRPRLMQGSCTAARTLRGVRLARTHRARHGSGRWHPACSSRPRKEDEMSTPWKTLALAAALWLSTADARAESAKEPRYGPCRAEGATSGNSADLRCGTELVRVRLVNVTTPALGETGFDEARRALHALLRGRELFIAFEIPGRPALDRDGCVRAYLYDSADQNMNIAMVALGWATYAASDGVDPLAKRFQLAEREARAEQRALWTVWTYTAVQLGAGD
jgi:endonuclease YncB( thermonuclease family)